MDTNKRELTRSEIPKSFFRDVRSILADARQRAYAAVNFIMVEAYWKIGRRIVKEEQGGKGRAEYGAYLIKELSRNLGEEFGRGFSVANLKNFRQFYKAFPDFEKGYALRSELTWTHYRLIMRLENEKVREWYIGEAATQRWSTSQLERNINSFYYERILSSGKQADVKASSARQIPDDFIKDPYVLEFLGIPEIADTSEQQIETAIINHLQRFLLELGKGFSFVGRQFRISTETSHFYIDLAFYNYLLKCFVLIDLKTTKLTHQDIGQMDMYVRMFDDLKRIEGDNPTIGIILCTSKDETIIHYSVLNESKQLFASKYMLYLPTEEELQRELEWGRRLIEERQQAGGEGEQNSD